LPLQDLERSQVMPLVTDVPLQMAVGLFFLIIVGLLSLAGFLPVQSEKEGDDGSSTVSIGGFASSSEKTNRSTSKAISDSMASVRPVQNRPRRGASGSRVEQKDVAIAQPPDESQGGANTETSRIACPDCGTPNSISKKYCSECGTPLQVPSLADISAADFSPISSQTGNPSEPIEDEDVHKSSSDDPDCGGERVDEQLL
jgi:hypothetical protein